MTNTNKIFIFDFDSTFIQVETLDILAEIGLSNHPEKAQRLTSIKNITNLAMEGRYSYSESLSERVPLLNLTIETVNKTIEVLKQKITPSFARNQEFFKKYAESIYIFSGAFIEIILPIVLPFGLKRNHVFGNRLLYDFENNIYGYDQNYVLAQDQGKVILAQQLKLKGDCVIVGDGYTDYEVKAQGLANTFVAFTENVKREKVIAQADMEIDSLEGLFLTCDIPMQQNTQKKVLLLENIHPFVADHFKNLGYIVESLKNSLEGPALIQKMAGVSVLGIRSKTEVTKEVINNAPQLEAIGAFCIGTNQIDLENARGKGIAAFNAPYSNTRSVVELALAEIIMLVRRASASSFKLQNGKWDKSSEGAHEVRGKTLGIIGYGHIGAQLSILAESLGMHVLFYDLEDKLALGNAKSCNLEHLLSHSDVVSIHVDGRKENQNIIGEKEFSLMKDGAIFLNLSRGFVVDMAALTKAVENGKLGGVGLDVYPEEPIGSKAEFKTPLQQFDNVILTPHIGGSTEEAQFNIGEYVSRNLHAYIKDGNTLSSVNFPQLYLPSVNHNQRIIHIHKNVPGILAKINNVFAEHQANIEGQFLKTNENIGYVITDINHEIEEDMLKALEGISNTIRVRILNRY